MKTETSPQEALTRRQFLLQAAVVSGALATPVNLFGQAAAVASGDAVETTELLHGWSLKSIEPQTELTAEFLSQAGRAAPDDGWFLEDNYFDLLPGEEKVVRVLGTHRRGRITAKPWYSPHTAAVNWQRSASVEQK